MRLKAISALTVFTTAMIVAFAGGNPGEPSRSKTDTIGEAREFKEMTARLAI